MSDTVFINYLKSFFVLAVAVYFESVNVDNGLTESASAALVPTAANAVVAKVLAEVFGAMSVFGMLVIITAKGALVTKYIALLTGLAYENDGLGIRVAAAIRDILGVYYNVFADSNVIMNRLNALAGTAVFGGLGNYDRKPALVAVKNSVDGVFFLNVLKLSAAELRLVCDVLIKIGYNSIDLFLLDFALISTSFNVASINGLKGIR